MEDNANAQIPAGPQQAAEQAVTQTAAPQVKVDDVVDAEVIKVAEFGAFVKFGNGRRGLIHISQVSDAYVKKVEDHLKVGDKVRAKVIKITPDGKIDLTLKSGRETARPREQTKRAPRSGATYRENMTSSPNGKSFKTSSFEDKLKHFIRESDERQSDFKRHIEEKQRR